MRGFPELKRHLTPGARVENSGDSTWRLEMPAGTKEKYRLAQLDDYAPLPRRKYLWNPPVTMELEARASAPDIPGTWGFGLWNDPFGMAIISGLEKLRLPVLPNAAWYFFASQQNYLSLRDDLPASGFLAATFCSPRWPGPFLALGAPVLPLMLLRSTAGWARKLVQRWVQQDTTRLHLDVTDWHRYELDWRKKEVVFRVDGQEQLKTSVSPQGPLGLVIWVDNQYAALPPEGGVHFGTLPTPNPTWIEVRNLSMEV